MTLIESPLPVLALRDIVVFPHMVAPLFVGRDKSVRALEAALNEEKPIFMVTQKEADKDEPTLGDIYLTGTVGNIMQLLRLPDGTVKVLVEGMARARVKRIGSTHPYIEADVELLPETPGAGEQELRGLVRTVMTQFENYIKVNKKIPPEVVVSLGQVEVPAKVADNVAAHLALKITDKQELLEETAVAKRLERVFALMEGEIDVLNVEKNVRSRVKTQMERNQREYYLNEQMKAIQKELTEGEDGKGESDDIESRIKTLKLTKEAREKAEAELKKLRTMSPLSAEASVIRNYLEWITGLPWEEPSEVKTDLSEAESVLAKEHYALDKVKERILEYLAVQARAPKNKSPTILCLVGAPGVGKTSLGRAIAEATGRTFVRMALGGMRDEAEIRGHRRTYIGSMPGKIIQGMKKAKTSNPLFLLDEIDKMGQDFRGDPSSALLEVLDPEQNKTFNDHYLEVDYDLSDVMFVCTANSLKMPQPLLDRMEIIRLSGYTEDEKVEIMRRHLLPKQMEANGLREGELTVEDSVLRDLVRYYTREAGVRSLERELANLCRKAVAAIVAKKQERVTISSDNLADYAGVRRYRFDLAEDEDQVGLVTGLAWTEVGGETLAIESVMLPGKGRIVSTGTLGDVMKESIQAAESFVRSRAPSYGIKPSIFDKRDIHVHVPEGATPKDGPSAGIAMMTSIVSVLTGIPVRKDIAMTGEITLRGRVLPIGGLKEKLLAALRSGIKTVLIPHENAKDLAEIPANVTQGLTIIPVAHADEVLQHALVRAVKPILWSIEDDEAMYSARIHEVMPESTVRH